MTLLTLRGGEVLAGSADQVLVDVDGDDPAAVTDQCADEGRVVAGAGAGLENAVARLRVELLQHQGNDRWLGCGADLGALAVGLDVDAVIGIGGFETGLGHEAVAGHAAQRGFDGAGADGALPDSRSVRALRSSRGMLMVFGGNGHGSSRSW